MNTTNDKRGDSLDHFLVNVGQLSRYKAGEQQSEIDKLKAELHGCAAKCYGLMADVEILSAAIRSSFDVARREGWISAADTIEARLHEAMTTVEYKRNHKA